MGTPSGGDGGNWPPDGGGPPELPSGWGPVVVPDDLSELAAEAARVRHELRGEARRRRWRRRLRWLLDTGPAGRSTMRLPLLILSIAVVATLTSLFALVYPASQRTGQLRSADGPSVPARPHQLPALDLLDRAGRAVSVRSLLPAVILLTEGCACDPLVVATATAAPPRASVLVVGRRLPTLPASVGSGRVRPLADPAGELRSLIGMPPSARHAGVLVVTGSADITRLLADVTAVDAFRADLDRLAGG